MQSLIMAVKTSTHSWKYTYSLQMCIILVAIEHIFWTTRTF